MNRDLAVLVGNGLSIAFNNDLNLQAITAEVLRRIQNADGDNVAAAMKEIAERALPDGASSAEDFELLVGTFGAESRTLGLLDELAKLTNPSDAKLHKAITRVAKFAEQVRDTGVSHVLEIIAERSHAYEDKAESLRLLLESIVQSFRGSVTFGNLNYDTILLAGLLGVCEPELADMGHGWKNVRVLIDKGRELTARALRTSASDFPSDRRVRLLHLHGSLTYWATRDEKDHAKLPKEVVVSSRPWEAIRKQETSIRPVVVLSRSRDKAEHVMRFPFNLAYEMFRNELRDAGHWLIVGYSFRDGPVNAALREEFAELIPKPQVLVVTYGDELKRKVVERALGWAREDGSSSEWLTLDRDGANRAHERPAWKKFAGV